ncbi:MAG: 4-alpha-glucanotransferase [Pseudomonadota bacterium]
MRRTGILLPLFSVPGPEPVGTIAGSGTWRLLDQLAEAGVALWQILPLPPDGANECPYSGASAFAVEPMYLSLERLAEEGLLPTARLAAAMAAAPVPERPDRVPWPALRAWKGPLLAEAAAAVPAAELEAWIASQGSWAFDWAAWWALTHDRREPWHRWPAPLRDHRPEALAEVPRLHRESFHHAAALQYLVDRQWSLLRRALTRRGLRLLGDLPLYVAGDSADCWAHRPLFQLGPDGVATTVAGAPPDYFTPEGQRWDNPVYDWEHSAATGHAWWRARFRRQMALVDELRIDHFRGFAAYYSFPFSESPREGVWTRGPGRGLFEALAVEQSALLGRPVAPSELPVVVEDLGFIDRETEALRDGLGFPGTKVLQFGFDGDPENVHHPCHYPTDNCLACTGTHDTQTARGWYERAPDWVHHHFSLMDRGRERSPARGLVRLALESRADHVVLPLQDVLELGDEARVNVPGTPTGNWRWRAPQLDADAIAWLRALSEATERTGSGFPG